MGEDILIGDSVADTVTGFTGIVTSRTEYLNGCVRVAIDGKSTEGSKPETIYCDIEQVQLLAHTAHTVQPEPAHALAPQQRSTGGDRPSPPERKPDR